MVYLLFVCMLQLLGYTIVQNSAKTSSNFKRILKKKIKKEIFIAI